MRVLRGRPPNVRKYERAGKVPALLRALEYEDQVTDRDGASADLGAPVRAEAAAALARADDPLAIEGLLRALADPEEEVRVAAIRGLRERGGPAALEALVSVATGWTGPERAQARSEAVDTLVDIGDPHVPPRVAAELLARDSALDDADCDVLARVARAGGGTALRSTVDDLLAHLREASAPERARRLLAALAPESVEPVIAALGDERCRRDAALALGAAQDARAVERLSSTMLSDDDPDCRRAAARALGEIRHPAAVEGLLLASRDPDFEVRTEAIDSFERLGNAGVALAVGALMQPALEESARQAVAALTEAREEHVIAHDNGSDPVERGDEEADSAAEMRAEAQPEPESEPDPPAAPEPVSAAEPQPPPDPVQQPTVVRRPPTRSQPLLRRLLDRYTRQ